MVRRCLSVPFVSSVPTLSCSSLMPLLLARNTVRWSGTRSHTVAPGGRVHNSHAGSSSSFTAAPATVKRILLIRCGMSDVMLDPAVILTTPDWMCPINAEGHRETIDTGKLLAAMLQREPVYFYFSPFLRAKDTMKALLEGALQVQKLNIIGVREDARLRDSDLGHYSSREEVLKCHAERETYGSFFYRFPHGESGADVCDRVSSFLDVFQREKRSFPPNTNVVVVTHDLTIRMFVKRWFHLTVETFNHMKPVPPSKIIELCRTEDPQKFKLTEDSTRCLGLPISLRDEDGYAFRNKKLLGSLSTGAPFL